MCCLCVSCARSHRVLCRSASMCASQAQGLAMKIQHSQKELKEKVCAVWCVYGRVSPALTCSLGSLPQSKEAKRAEREHAKQQKELQTKKNRLDSLKKKLAVSFTGPVGGCVCISHRCVSCRRRRLMRRNNSSWSARKHSSIKKWRRCRRTQTGSALW